MNKIETAEYNRVLEQNKSLQTEVIKLRQENEDLRVIASQLAQESVKSDLRAEAEVGGELTQRNAV